VAEFLSWSFSEVLPGLNSPLLNQSTKSGASHQKNNFLQSKPARREDAIMVTTVRPEPGAVEFCARLEREKGAAAQLPTYPQPLNLC
jgi:hypothetical protein